MHVSSLVDPPNSHNFGPMSSFTAFAYAYIGINPKHMITLRRSAIIPLIFFFIFVLPTGTPLIFIIILKPPVLLKIC